MAYKVENYRLVRERFEEKRHRAVREAELRREEIHRLCPEIAVIDEALAKTGMQIFTAACGGGEDVQERIARIRRENEQLLSERRALLTALGYPTDYTDACYECPKCKDSGFVNCRMCECMHRELVLEGFRSSGIGRMIDRQSFDNFSLDYYRTSDADYERMKINLEAAIEFSETAPPAYENLLLCGSTGLGKTHLSSAIAKRVIERGYDVKYESVQNILSDFEHDRFRSGYGAELDERSHVYLEAELLIIDDLGTEMTNTFTVSVLYQIVNTRINQGRPTVISTNLTQKELRERYGDRVASRIFGEYRPLLFCGRDVRFQMI
jgi:DNA replication protein DnaC